MTLPVTGSSVAKTVAVIWSPHAMNSKNDNPTYAPAVTPNEGVMAAVTCTFEKSRPKSRSTLKAPEQKKPKTKATPGTGVVMGNSMEKNVFSLLYRFFVQLIGSKTFDNKEAAPDKAESCRPRPFLFACLNFAVHTELCGIKQPV